MSSSRELKRLERQIVALKGKLAAVNTSLDTVVQVLGTIMAGDAAVSNASTSRARTAPAKDAAKAEKSSRAEKSASDRPVKSPRSSGGKVASDDKGNSKSSRPARKRD